jgi:hypothetical protein
MQGGNMVRAALEMLQRAMPMLQIGSEQHAAVVKAVADLSKHVGEVGGAGDPAAMIQQLAQMARQRQQAPQPASMAGGGGGAPPGLVPPPPAGGAPPPGA